jgi:hypothetical protein
MRGTPETCPCCPIGLQNEFVDVLRAVDVLGSGLVRLRVGLVDGGLDAANAVVVVVLGLAAVVVLDQPADGVVGPRAGTVARRKKTGQVRFEPSLKRTAPLLPVGQKKDLLLFGHGTRRGGEPTANSSVCATAVLCR